MFVFLFLSTALNHNCLVVHSGLLFRSSWCAVIAMSFSSRLLGSTTLSSVTYLSAGAKQPTGLLFFACWLWTLPREQWRGWGCLLMVVAGKGFTLWCRHNHCRQVHNCLCRGECARGDIPWGFAGMVQRRC